MKMIAMACVIVLGYVALLLARRPIQQEVSPDWRWHRRRAEEIARHRRRIAEQEKEGREQKREMQWRFLDRRDGGQGERVVAGGFRRKDRYLKEQG